MKILTRLLLLSSLLSFCLISSGQSPSSIKVTPAGKGKVNPAVDNMGYWKEMIRKGYVKADPYREVPPAIPGSSLITGDEIQTQDSPDVPTTSETATTQSENSVFVSPEDEEELLNSNNSTTWNGASAAQLYGSDCLYSEDAGLSWLGSILYAGDANFGDPVTAIGLNGRYYIGKININYGQSVAWSDNKGADWHEVTVAGVPSPGLDLLDKNHMTIDNSLSSPYEGNLYDAWTAFVNDQNGKVEITRSTNDGVTWSAPIEISAGANAASHNQGVNIQTGPNGEVYAVWAVYDDFPDDEKALGFARSFNGGTVFQPAFRIIDNIKGIRNSGVGKGVRVNSFPSMAVDRSGGSYDGAIYVVWPNYGVPGINTGSDVDVYMIRSFDQGSTWSAPIRINQDTPGLSKKHFMAWITCDPENGNLAVIYYDDRNTTNFRCETYISYSYDAGDSWTDLKVSDVVFTPAPISGLAMGYFGDYLGITAKNRKVYPVWTDNRTGKAMSYISPVELGPAPGQSFVVYNSNILQRVNDSVQVQGLTNGDSVYLNISLENLGDQDASGVTAYLSSPSQWVKITDSTAFYGDFAPGAVKDMPYGFSADVSDTIPDNERIRFNLRCVSTDTTWLSHFILRGRAPSLKIISLKIFDTINGNHNYKFDPGETAVLTFKITNTGDYSCPGTATGIQTTNENLVFQQDSVPAGTIASGDTVSVSYTVTVSGDAVFGSWADITLGAKSGLYHISNTFIEKIGTIVEDWETGNFQKFPWSFGGNANWILTTINPFEGIYSAKSYPIFEEQTSVIKIDYSSGVSDSISFWLKTSSEPSYDFLNFYIDDVKQGQWSGEILWQRASFATPAGTHTYKWEYAKDIFYDAGEDCAWIDYIDFPPPVLPLVNAGNDDTICAGMVYQTQPEISGSDSVMWMTYGDGIFSNAAINNPVYTPGTADIAAGSVKLKLTAYGINGSSANSMILYIGQIPESTGIKVWPNDTVCAGQTIELSVDTLEGGTYKWLPGGATTSTIVADTALAGGTGPAVFTATTTSAMKCSITDTIVLIFKDCTGIEEAGPQKVIIKPNPFRESTTIGVLINNTRDVSVTISDSRGISVKHINTDKISAGFCTFVWDGKNDQGDNVAAGVYRLVIREGSEQTTYSIILTR